MAALGIARASAAVSQAESFSGSMRRQSMLEQMQQEGSAFRSSLRRLEDDSQAELEYVRARLMTTGQTTIERAARGRNLARDKEPEHTTKRSQRGLSRGLSSLSDSLCLTGVHAHKDHFHDPSEAITFIPASATVERDGEVEIGRPLEAATCGADTRNTLFHKAAPNEEAPRPQGFGQD